MFGIFLLCTAKGTTTTKSTQSSITCLWRLDKTLILLQTHTITHRREEGREKEGRRGGRNGGGKREGGGGEEVGREEEGKKTN